MITKISAIVIMLWLFVLGIDTLFCKARIILLSAGWGHWLAQQRLYQIIAGNLVLLLGLITLLMLIFAYKVGKEKL